MNGETPRRSLPAALVLGVVLPLLGAAAGWGAAQARLGQLGEDVERLGAHHERDVQQLRDDVREVARQLVEERTWRAAHARESEERWDRVRERLGIRRASPP